MDEGMIFECTKTPDFSLLELLSPPCLEPPSPPCLEPPPSLYSLSHPTQPITSDSGTVAAGTVGDGFPLGLSESESGGLSENSETAPQLPGFTVLCLLQEAANLVPVLPSFSKPTYQSKPGATENPTANTSFTQSSDTSLISHPGGAGCPRGGAGYPNMGAGCPSVGEGNFSQYPNAWSSTEQCVCLRQGLQSEEGSLKMRQILETKSEGQRGDPLLTSEKSNRNSVPGVAPVSGYGRMSPGSPGEGLGAGWGVGESDGRLSSGWVTQCPRDSPQSEMGAMPWSYGEGGGAETEKGIWVRVPEGNTDVCSQEANGKQDSSLDRGGKRQEQSDCCPSQTPKSSAAGSEPNVPHQSGKAKPPTAAAALHPRTPRKQATPQRSAELGDPSFEGVTLRMERRIVGGCDCQLRITAHYSPGLRQKLRRIRARCSRVQSVPRCSSSEEDSPNTGSGKSCASCGTEKTPLWRDAEDGTPLCNACGIRYKKYRIRCSNCWHIPKKEGKWFIKCVRCGDPLRLSLSERKVAVR